MTFEQAMVLTRTIGSHTSFEEEECKAYFYTLMRLQPGSLIVEIGLEYGRSSSIALQVAKERGLRYLGIDPFRSDVKVGTDPSPILGRWMGMATTVTEGNINSYPFTLAGFKFVREFSDAIRMQDVDIHAVLIDGDHSYDQVLRDLEHFAPHVVQGGYLMCHDYERGSIPEVTNAVADYMEQHPMDWKAIGTFCTLGIWRRN